MQPQRVLVGTCQRVQSRMRVLGKPLPCRGGQRIDLILHLFRHPASEPAYRQLKANCFEATEGVIMQVMPFFPKLLISRIAVEETSQFVYMAGSQSARQMVKHV